MSTVIRFPIERRDFGGDSPLAAGESAVIIPFPARGSRAVAVIPDRSRLGASAIPPGARG